MLLCRSAAAGTSFFPGPSDCRQKMLLPMFDGAPDHRFFGDAVYDAMSLLPTGIFRSGDILQFRRSR